MQQAYATKWKEAKGTELCSSWDQQAEKAFLVILSCTDGKAAPLSSLFPLSQWAVARVKPQSSLVNGHLISHSCGAALLREVKSGFFSSELKGLKGKSSSLFIFVSGLEVIVTTLLDWLAVVYCLPLNGSFAHYQLLAKKVTTRIVKSIESYRYYFIFVPLIF